MSNEKLKAFEQKVFVESDIKHFRELDVHFVILRGITYLSKQIAEIAQDWSAYIEEDQI